MRTNKLSLIAAMALGGLIACGTAANAQDGKDKGGKRGPSVEQRLERMSDELKLTDAQKPKVKAILEEGSKKMQDLSSLPREERRDKMQAIREEEHKKLKAILTPEQNEKLDKMREQFRKKGPPGGPEGDKKSDKN